jgi:hypothetical protein
MRNSVPSVALGVALAAGTSVAHAQAVETIIAPAPGPAVIAQAPVAVPPSGVLLAQPGPTVAAAPVETVETVRSVETTTPRTARRRAVHNPVRVTTTRTIVRERVATAPVVVPPPAYNELLDGPRYYDYVPPAAVVPAQPAPAVMPATAPVMTGAPIPTYRYIYEPDRILVIDPYTNIAVQAIPR